MMSKLSIKKDVGKVSPLPTFEEFQAEWERTMNVFQPTLEERVARFPNNPTLLDLMARRNKLDSDIFMVLRMCEAIEDVD